MESDLEPMARADMLMQKIEGSIQPVINFKAHGRRVMFYVKHVASAKKLHDALTQAGIKSFDFCNTKSSTQRSAGFEKFNDPENFDFDVLITTFRRGVDGGKFSGACCDGIILEFPDNIITMKTTQRVFQHPDQKEGSTWTAMCIEGTYDLQDDFLLSHQEAIMILADPKFHQKMTPFKTIPKIDPRITGQHSFICAYEIIRNLYGADSSRYPRARMHWTNMGKPEVVLEGQFYAAVGRFLMANPTSTDKFTKATMQWIALRWEPSTEISKDRLVGYCPPLPNGVKIYNFVEEGKGGDML